MRSQLRVPASVKGALVVEVAPDSAAAEAGLQRGDIIQEINRKPVRDAEGLVELTRKAEDKATLLRVWREGSSRFVVVDETNPKEQ
jgi:serine protease Do